MVRWIGLLFLFQVSLALVNLPDGTSYESYEIFETKPKLIEAYQTYVRPKVNLQDCSLDFNSIPNYTDSNTNMNTNYTVLAILPQIPCTDYLNYLSDFQFIQSQLAMKKYPILSTILFLTDVDENLASPLSSINLNHQFQPQVNLTYQVVSDRQFVEFNPTLVLISPSLNLWNNLLNSNTNFCWTVVFKVVKYILLIIQFILLAFVCARTKFKGQLQICLLLVGVIQLGGEMVLSWSNPTQLTYKSFLSILLLPACIVNSLVVLSWCNIVWRLQTSVKITKFKVAVMVESFLLVCAICIQIGLVVGMCLWVTQRQFYAYPLQLVALVLMTGLSLIMLVWFFKIALNFCPIFHCTAKLINAQWLTLFIVLTRLFFIVNLVSTNLFLFRSSSPSQYLAFSIVNNFASIAYNTIIVLIVVKMQSIKSQQHRWTPDQLGLVTLPDGTVVATPTHNTHPTDLTAVNSQVSIPNEKRSLPTLLPNHVSNLENLNCKENSELANSNQLPHQLRFFPPPPSIPIPPIPTTTTNLQERDQLRESDDLELELDAWGTKQSGF